MPFSISAHAITADIQDDGPLLAATEIPEAPTPQNTPVAAGSQSGPVDPPSGSSSSAAPGSAVQPVPQTADEKARHDQAEKQLKQEEHQRVIGVMAAFNTTQNHEAIPLSPSQKYELFFKSETDPWPFLLSAAVAGIEQANDSYPEWGQGAKGYGKRIGAAYSDAFIGNFFGNAVLPIVLHEDPRFYQKTDGSAMRRTLWAATSTVWAKRDNGSWGPNYANVGGNLIGAAIARLYYPPSERTVSETIYDGLTVTVEGVVGSEVIEWWPAIVRRHNRKMAEKMARQMQPNPSISH